MKFRWVFILAALYAAPVATSAHPPLDAPKSWHKLTDRQRGMRIVSAALADNGKVGGQCKVWVQSIISRATDGHVTVPQNSAEVSHTWKSDKSGHIINLGARIARAQPGDIVQMVIKDRNGRGIPHTAIVGSNSRGTITWLESNYPSGEIVRVNRTQTVAQFESSLIDGRYTVYRIG
jgi:hypothetical protein